MNQHLGAISLHDIPKSSAHEQHVDVRFTYDLNGILDVDITSTSTGKTKSVTMETGPNKLNREQIHRARQALQRLKFHPRDALPNITALARADALYVELVGATRERLGQAIGHFRAVLETQDTKGIEGARGQLLAVLSEIQAGRTGER